MHVVRFTGPFGFIKPWTAVRDAETYSQPFLTQSIVEGIRQKLAVTGILRHRLQHRGISVQQERTQSAGWRLDRKRATRQASIIKRGVLLQPALYLAFPLRDDAESAARQHVCLCRNEDVLLPGGALEMDECAFDAIPGVELLFGEGDDAFLAGFNRFAQTAPMYGRLVVVEGEMDEELLQ